MRRLPELLSSRTAREVRIRRAWLCGDAAHALADEPWASDHVSRLVRNDGTPPTIGPQHPHALTSGPVEWIEEPILHLDLLVRSEAERRDRALRSEVAAPRLRARAGGRLHESFHVPELSAPHRLVPLAAEDRARVERALTAGGPVPARDPGPLSIVPLAESDRFWDGRDVPASAYRATLEPIEVHTAMEPGELAVLFFRVRNDGTERWPWSLDHRPAIRASYRWLYEDGEVHVADGPRTPFPRTVEPGETVVMPVRVIAPSDPNSYVLEIDLVHDDVRWFGAACHVPVVVWPADHLPPHGERLRVSASPPDDAPLLIPRTIHRVWVGDAPLPDAHRAYGDGFARLHPEWEMRLWTDADLLGLGIGERELAAVRKPSELSNLMRYEVLRRFGGVYVDTDVECLRPFDDLLRGVECFAALELPGRVGTAVLGCVPGHPAFVRAAALARQTLGTGAHSADANGPYLVSLILEQEPGVTIFGAERFYPYRWDEPERADEDFPDAYAVHRWTLSWWPAAAGG